MTESNPLPADPLHGQPHEIVERDGVRYTLLGTAHVSRASVDAVRAAVASGDYDSVAVELDPGRLQSLTDPDTPTRLDLVKVIREGKTHQIPGMIQVGKKLGNQPLDDAIMEHLRMKRISPEEAYDKCLDKKKFRPFLTHPPDDEE